MKLPLLRTSRPAMAPNGTPRARCMKLKSCTTTLAEAMCYPVSEGVVTHISFAVDEHAAAGQVREHGAGISGWHFEAKYSGRVDVLPVRHKENSQWIKDGLHDPNLSAYQGFLLGRTSEDCVAVCGRFRRGCFFADQLCVPVRLSPAELCKSQDE